MKKRSLFPVLFACLLLLTAAQPKLALKGPVFTLNAQFPNYSFSDQFGAVHKVDNTTERLIVALDKEAAHAVNDFLASQSKTFLADHHTHLIVDVSAAPGIIQKMFILPGLKKFDYPVLIFRDKEEAAPFRMGMNANKLLLVKLENKKITALREYEPSLEAVKTMLPLKK